MLPYNHEKTIYETEELSEQLKRTTKKLLLKAHKLKAIEKFSKNEDINYELLKKCVKSIDSKIDGIVIHDNLKSAYKNVVKKLGEELGVPVFKHKKLKKPSDLPI